MKKILVMCALTVTACVVAPKVARADLVEVNYCAYLLEEGGAAGIEAYEQCEAEAGASTKSNGGLEGRAQMDEGGCM